jgi:MscS family membrane protein
MLEKYFGVTLFGWSFFLIFLPLEYLALSLINRFVGAAAGYAIRRWAHRPEMRNPTILPHPLRLLILSGTIRVALHKVGLSLLARQAGSTSAVLILIVAGVWAMFLIDARGEAYFKQRMESNGNLGATAVLRPARRMMDLLAVIVGLTFLLDALGINPTATLAGLGVGGIAIALAAQKTLENVIGGASLIVDGAVRVGDVFKIGNVVGAVEVIGLRSTRVRTLDRTVLTIPNGQMATLTLENLSSRDQFLFRHVIGIELETSPAALGAILAQIRNLLERDSRVVPDSARVRFLRFLESGLEVEVFAYVTAGEWDHFLEIQEDLLIKVRQLSSSIGVKFAYPSRSIYLKNDTETAGPQPQSPMNISNFEAGHELHSR